MTVLRWSEPDELDPAWRDGLLGPGKIFELAEEDVGGVVLPVFTQRPRSIVEVLEGAATKYDRPFLIGPEETVRFSEAPDRVRSIAGTLQAFGVEPGDRVALAGRPTVEHALTIFAVATVGGIVTTINPSWTATEIEYAISLTEPKLAIVDENVVDRVPGSRTFASLLAPEDKPFTAVDIDEDDPFAILFTSGTTGRPKAATLSHRNVVQFFLAAAATAAVHSLVHQLPSTRSEHPAVIGSSPLFHVSGLLGQLANSPSWGTTIVLPSPGRWDATEHLRLTEQHRVTSWSLVPTQLWRLIEHPDLDTFDLSSLEMVGGGGAMFEPELLRRTSEALPNVKLSLRVGYGMTETAGTLSMLQPPVAPEHVGSVGQPFAGTEICICDEQGTPCPDGAVGEIWGRGAQVFLGYWGDEAATAAAITPDRWYRTGDYGRITDGFLFLESRRTDLIIRGGENIYPIEIENRLVEHPDIAEAAVVGIDHADLGQEVMAVVVPRAGAAITEDDVRAFVAETHARYKVPAVVQFRAELPRNETGKVQKRELVKPRD